MEGAVLGEARALVDSLNERHYELLAERDAVTESIRANSAELADAVDALAEAEALAAREAQVADEQLVDVGAATEVTSG